MSVAELTALLLFCTAMSFSPGPNTTLSTALAANLALKRALRFCFAVPAGWTLLMLGSGLGLGALITGVPALRWAVTLLGVAVHDRSRLQVVDGFGQLQVRLAIEDAGQAQVGEARRIFNIHVGRDANVVN